MVNSTPWYGPDGSADHFVETSVEAIFNDVERLAGHHAGRPEVLEALRSSAAILEGSPSEAAQTLGVLARRMAERVILDAGRGDMALINLLQADRLTDDFTADYFVKLTIQLITAQAADDAADLAQARSTLLDSLRNVEREPKMATDAVLALSNKLAALQVAEVLRPRLGLDANMSAAEVSIVVGGMRGMTNPLANP